MKTDKSPTIAQEIRTIEGSGLDFALKIRALTNLYFNRRHEHGDVGRIMLTIETMATQLALRVAEPELGFDKLWSEFDSNFSSVRSVAKSAMKIGYVAGKLDITK